MFASIYIKEIILRLNWKSSNFPCS